MYCVEHTHNEMSEVHRRDRSIFKAVDSIGIFGKFESYNHELGVSRFKMSYSHEDTNTDGGMTWTHFRKTSLRG